jgi:hypothetical protein
MVLHGAEGNLCSACLRILQSNAGFDLQTLAVSLPVRMQQSRELWDIVLSQNPCALQFAPDAVKNDLDLVLECVTRVPLTFRFASESLRNNYTIADAAVRGNSTALRYASERLRNDANFVLIALLCDPSGSCIRFGSELVRDDENLASIAVTRDGYNLKFVSERLRDNKNIVNIACAETPSAICLASTSLQNQRSKNTKINDLQTLPAAFLHHYFGDSNDLHPSILTKIKEWKAKRCAFVLSVIDADLVWCFEMLNFICEGFS